MEGVKESDKGGWGGEGRVKQPFRYKQRYFSFSMLYELI